MIKGIILDFNGTLYLDHDLNHDAWEKAFNSVKTKESNKTYDDFEENIETLTKDYDYAKAILDMFDKNSSKENVIKLADYKEVEYRKMARILNRTEIMRGAPKLLDYLKENNIKYCIASMAPRSNFNFYLDYLHLNKWFSYDNIVYDEEKYQNKNDQYIEAAKRMNLDLKECLLIEDSPKVIDRAIELGIDKIIYMNTKNKKYIAKEIIQEISNFDELDLSILKSKI